MKPSRKTHPQLFRLTLFPEMGLNEKRIYVVLLKTQIESKFRVNARWLGSALKISKRDVHMAMGMLHAGGFISLNRRNP